MSTKLPLVSVVIPAFNEEKFIGKTLESLQNQDYQGTYEIIVVNNASTDKTAEIAASYGAKVLYQPVKGLRPTREMGFAHATGEYIASTDADDILPPHWISRFVDTLSKDAELVAVGGWFKLNSGPIVPRFMVNMISAPFLFCYATVFRKQLLQDQNYMVKKWAYDRCGGYTGLDSMHEDLLLAQRLVTVGKVKFYYGLRWAVLTSSRRWNNGFVMGAAHYAINAFYYAATRKTIIKDFSDIRHEKQSHIAFNKQIGYVLAVLLLLTGGLGLTLPQADAKIAPVTKKAQKKIMAQVNSAKKSLNFEQYSQKYSNVVDQKFKFPKSLKVPRVDF